MLFNCSQHFCSDSLHSGCDCPLLSVSRCRISATDKNCRLLQIRCFSAIIASLCGPVLVLRSCAMSGVMSLSRNCTVISLIIHTFSLMLVG